MIITYFKYGTTSDFILHIKNINDKIKNICIFFNDIDLEKKPKLFVILYFYLFLN